MRAEDRQRRHRVGKLAGQPARQVGHHRHDRRSGWAPRSTRWTAFGDIASWLLGTFYPRHSATVEARPGVPKAARRATWYAPDTLHRAWGLQRPGTHREPAAPSPIWRRHPRSATSSSAAREHRIPGHHNAGRDAMSVANVLPDPSNCDGRAVPRRRREFASEPSKRKPIFVRKCRRKVSGFLTSPRADAHRSAGAGPPDPRGAGPAACCASTAR